MGKHRKEIKREKIRRRSHVRNQSWDGHSQEGKECDRISESSDLMRYGCMRRKTAIGKNE